MKKAFVSIFAIFFSAIITSVLVGMFSLLIKQVQILNIDASSFQAYYVADSAFECIASKEKNATGTASYLLPNNYSSFGFCQSAGDVVFTQAPVNNGGRATSTLKYSVSTAQGNFCGSVVAGKEVDRSVERNDVLIISGQSKSCGDPDTYKIIERGIDFYY